MNMTSQSIDPNVGHLGLTAKAKGALFAAAVGDALGWPYEMNRTTPEPQNLGFSFKKWRRRAGSRFYPHIEVVGPGEYSDDTQLILSTFRALRHSEEWWMYLAEVELPCWLVYERGGGQATKRSAESWTNRRPPWKGKQDDQRRYFEAGGNGVAMRILPHCILGARETGFERTAAEIVANGVVTHGHPRALVGALAYGYVLWSALRNQGTLSFGALISSALAESQNWKMLPEIAGFFADWLSVAEDFSKGEYHTQWARVVDEQVQLLETAAAAIKKGALSLDEQAIKDLGCFDPRYGGAGTRTAAAAVFLASRFAAEPQSGLIWAAQAKGTDTDTIASMTGAILGALAGQEWLGALIQEVQDGPYLADLVDAILAPSHTPEPRRSIGAISRKDTIGLLEKKHIGDAVELPDGRRASLCARIDHEASSSKTLAISWKLRCDDGQTLFVKRIGKRNEASHGGEANAELFEKSPYQQPVPAASRVGVKVFVEDLSRVRDFYRDALGLQIQKQSAELVNFGGTFTLVALSGREVDAETRRYACQGNTVVYVEAQDPQATFKAVTICDANIITPLRDGIGGPCFRCLDPAGNLVEVYRAKSKGNV